MLAPVQSVQWASFAHVYPPSFLNIASSDRIERIKEFAMATFTKFLGFLKSFNNQSKEINTKKIAMISCVSLIVLLVIALLRRRNAQLVHIAAQKKEKA